PTLKEVRPRHGNGRRQADPALRDQCPRIWLTNGVLRHDDARERRPAVPAILMNGTDEAIAPLWHRLDGPGVFGNVLELLAKDVDELREVALFHHDVRPDCVDQVLLWDQLPIGLEEEAKHIDCLRRQPEPQLAPIDSAAARVEPE